MVSWELSAKPGCPEEWDAALLASEDFNVFQSFAWGEYKRASGWQPRRWLARDGNGAIVAMAQILTKSFFPGVTVGWVPGGPVLRFARTSRYKPLALLQGLLECNRGTAGLTWVRFHSQLPHEADLAYAFAQVCKRPAVPLTSGYSILLDLRRGLDELVLGMTPKHRYCVRKSLEEKIQWRMANDESAVEALADLLAKMVRHKGLPDRIAPSRDLAALCAALKEHASILVGYMEEEPVVACLVLTFGTRAFYLRAATGLRGRALGASYAMVGRLLEQLRERGITEFDFGGLDPWSPRAAGINHFKRGFGGTLVEYLGEWEWASSTWLRWGMNLALRWCGGRL